MGIELEVDRTIQMWEQGGKSLISGQFISGPDIGECPTADVLQLQELSSGPQDIVDNTFRAFSTSARERARHFSAAHMIESYAALFESVSRAGHRPAPASGVRL